MKTSEFLKIVKRDHLAVSEEDYINTDKARYLCLAIDDAWYIHNEYKLIAEGVKWRINISLQRWNSVVQWLRYECKVDQKALFVKGRGGVEYSQAVYDYRHRWIDELIRQYESNGD